jgi:hypothetical protein
MKPNSGEYRFGVEGLLLGRKKVGPGDGQGHGG